MKFISILPVLFLTAIHLCAQVDLTTSNLPILIIETENGIDIPDEPKIDAQLGIIWNGDGEINSMDDPFNNYDGKIAIEKRGASSQAIFPKVGYAFETRNDDDSNNNVSLLGFPDENDWVLHGPYSDKSLIRNALSYILAGRIMEYAPRVKFCEVVLNGDYIGVYLFTEKIKRDADRVNISSLNPEENAGDELTGGYILKFDKNQGVGFDGFYSQYPAMPGGVIGTFFQYHYPKFDEISSQQKTYIQNYISELEDVLQSPQFADEQDGYRKYLDMPSFYQYLFIQEIGRNVDGYRLSTYFYKDKDSVNGKLKFGPIWDFNLAFGNVDYCIGSGSEGWAKDFNDVCPGDFWVVHFWWSRLWQDPLFKQELKEYWQDLRTAELSDDSVFQIIDSLGSLLEEPAQRNFERWPVLDQYVWPNGFVGGTYELELDYLQNWTTDRLAWLDENMELLSSIDSVPSEPVNPTVQPNPFSGQVTFKYDCPNNENVRIEIYDVQGRFVEELVDPETGIGLRALDWKTNIPNGIYFYKIKFSSGKTAVGKLVRNGS